MTVVAAEPLPRGLEARISRAAVRLQAEQPGDLARRAPTCVKSTMGERDTNRRDSGRLGADAPGERTTGTRTAESREAPSATEAVNGMASQGRGRSRHGNMLESESKLRRRGALAMAHRESIQWKASGCKPVVEARFRVRRSGWNKVLDAWMARECSERAEVRARLRSSASRSW